MNPVYSPEAGYAVVFDMKQAEHMFYHGCQACLCIDVPRCLWVSNYGDAVLFYAKEEKWKEHG
jgi:hypothetical protein